MKIRYITLVFVSLLIIGLHSCSKDEAYDSENDAIVAGQLDLSKQSVEHQALFEYARLISIAIQKGMASIN